MMNETTTMINPPADDASAHAALVDHYINEMKRIQQQMADDREEILLLQAETRAIIDDVMTTLKAA